MYQLQQQSYACLKSSHLRVESALISFTNSIPTILSLNSAGMPVPGLFRRISLDDILSPDFTSLAVTRLRTVFFISFSQSAGFLFHHPLPSQHFLSLLPLPLTLLVQVKFYGQDLSISLSSVKCFSITFAPIATAAIVISVPIV